MSNQDYAIGTAPKDGRLIEVKFPGGWARVSWDQHREGYWRTEGGALRVDGGGCMPGEWVRIGRWREVS
jgi:hypothetical protein